MDANANQNHLVAANAANAAGAADPAADPAADAVRALVGLSEARASVFLNLLRFSALRGHLLEGLNDCPDDAAKVAFIEALLPLFADGAEAASDANDGRVSPASGRYLQGVVGPAISVGLCHAGFRGLLAAHPTSKAAVDAAVASQDRALRTIGRAFQAGRRGITPARKQTLHRWLIRNNNANGGVIRAAAGFLASGHAGWALADAAAGPPLGPGNGGGADADDGIDVGEQGADADVNAEDPPAGTGADGGNGGNGADAAALGEDEAADDGIEQGGDVDVGVQVGGIGGGATNDPPTSESDNEAEDDEAEGDESEGDEVEHVDSATDDDSISVVTISSGSEGEFGDEGTEDEFPAPEAEEEAEEEEEEAEAILPLEEEGGNIPGAEQEDAVEEGADDAEGVVDDILTIINATRSILARVVDSMHLSGGMGLLVTMMMAMLGVPAIIIAPVFLFFLGALAFDW